MVKQESKLIKENTEFGFIGHSLGGLIIREGAKHLGSIRDKLILFLSFNTPHLGCITSKFLVKTGMKILSMMSGKESMRQMGLQDANNFIQNLSKHNSISFFENIFLVYSYEDGYSPLSSSKIVNHFPNTLSSQLCNNFWQNTKVIF
jgi:hypothetical protein